ncbi:hypothetical protein MMC20_008004 [Loxospora ochrophaea]|nr:hypothetical protein [Loxospora ochrophaea]
MSSETLPPTHRALVLTSRSQPAEVKTIPTPRPTPGSAVVRVLVSGVLSYSRDIYDGTRAYPFPTPLVIGTGAIGRVAAVGPDATLLTPGQLVYVDLLIRGRDDPSVAFLSGIAEGFTDGSRKLMHGEWRDSTYAEYVKAPLENCIALNEKRLLGTIDDGGLGYLVEDLMHIGTLLVAYGGLKDIDLKPGETVIVAPATGSFGGAAAAVAIAMGAKVIAVGRNLDALKKLAATSPRIEIMQMMGDVEKEVKALQEFGTIDAFFDISPDLAAKSTHIKSGILALRHSGRVSLMGGIREDVALPYRTIMHQNLQLKGKWMYEREDIGALIKLIDIGFLKLGENAGQRLVGKFGLEDWKSAFDAATENPGPGERVLIAP